MVVGEVVERAYPSLAAQAFYFDEDEGFAVPANQVDLTAPAVLFRHEVTVKNLVAVPAQEFRGQFFPARADCVNMVGIR